MEATDRSHTEPATGSETSGNEQGPDPREHTLADGGLVVSTHWVHGTRGATTVAAEDVPFYRLLLDVLSDANVPDLMPADLAAECEDLADAQEHLADIDRGHVSVNNTGYGLSYVFAAQEAIEEYRESVSLAAVGCSGLKYEDEGTMPAKERYKSGYWTCKRRYGEHVVDGYKVISAEHAVLDPETPIEYYERTPDDLDGVPVESDARLPNGDTVDTLLDQWALDVYNGLTRWLADRAGGLNPKDVELEVLLGRKYKDRLTERGVFENLRIPGELSISHPYQEVEQAQGGQGYQMGWMTDEIDAATEGESDV